MESAQLWRIDLQKRWKHYTHYTRCTVWSHVKWQSLCKSFKVSLSRYYFFQILVNKEGGKMVFIRNELLAKRLENFKTTSAETICITFLISKRKWRIIFTYRPSQYDKKVFFQEWSKTVSRAINKYDRILVAGDSNIDVSGSNGLNDNHFCELIDTFNLINLVKTSTCFKTTRGILLDVLLTHKSKSLQKTAVCETGLCDYYKMIFTIFRSTFIWLPQKLLNIETIKVLMKTFFAIN